MTNKRRILIILTVLLSTLSNAQIILVDLGHSGTSVIKTDTSITNSIHEALELSYQSLEDSIQIVLLPGVYILKDIVRLKKSSKNKDSSTLIIRSSVNPDEEIWSNKDMPVIMSISSNNDSTSFPHAVGILVQRNNVFFSGIKFLGNANPEVLWYYPISRKDTLLTKMTVKQCVFIGDANSLPIQAGIYGFGSKIEIENNIFKSCRNASLFFNNAKHSTFNSNIVINTDESVVWIDNLEGHFKMTNNLISDSNFGIVKNPIDSNLYSIESNIFNQVDTLAITYEYQIDTIHNRKYFYSNTFDIELIQSGKAHPYWDRRNLHFDEPKKKVGIFIK